MLKYFKLQEDVPVKLFDGGILTLNKDTIFHVQSSFVSPIDSEEMVVIAMDKCTPIAVPAKTGQIFD